MNQIDHLKEKTIALSKRRLSSLAILNELKAQEAVLKNKAAVARTRLAQAEPVKNFLERLQKREHERSVGAYENLLTAFLNDVLPGNRDVVMELSSERGAPSLDINIRKGPGLPLEDAFRDTGGSVTNILSVGLRVIALLRSDRRKFLILDESDCWIKPDLIPGFAKTVAQISKDLGVQILMVSHHKESRFSSHIKHRLRLDKSSGKLVAEWSPTSEIPEWSDDQDGIRSIEIKNVKSHEHTFLNLSPEITLLQGDNDIGKSVVAEVMRAIFDQDSNESTIRHGAASCEVNIDFGPNKFLLNWKRYRKGKVKMSYKLYSNSDMSVIHSNEGTKTPDWLLPNCGIARCDGLDIQIGQQKKPVFLLDLPASERAKALSIGQESSYISGMMAVDKKELQEARSSLADAELDLENMRHRIYALSAIENTSEPSGIDEILNQNAKSILIKKSLSKTKNANFVFNILNKTPPNIDEFNFEFTSLKINQYNNKIKELENKSKILKKLSSKIIKEPLISENRALPLLEKISKYYYICDVLKSISNGVDVYDFNKIGVKKFALKLRNAKNKMDVFSNLNEQKVSALIVSENKKMEFLIRIKNMENYFNKINDDYLSMEEEFKEMKDLPCPTCQRPFA